MTFALISEGRSGTQMLVSAIRQHPHIETFDFTAVQVPNIPGLFREVSRSKYLEWGDSTIGTVTHCWGEGYITKEFKVPVDVFWKRIFSDHDHIIFLRRTNLLRQFLSRNTLALTAEPRSVSTRTETPPSLEIDTGDLRDELIDMTSHRENACRYLPVRLDITYEAMCSHWSETLETVLRYLGEFPAMLQPTTVKQERRPLREIIRNYNEVASFLRDINREDWLHEQEVA